FINLSNGNLHIEIPLASQTQRGTLSLNERLVYDSRVWTIGFNASTGHNQWYPTNVSGNMGWRFVDVSGRKSFKSHVFTCDLPPPRSATYTVYSNFTFTDEIGTVRAFSSLQT